MKNVSRLFLLPLTALLLSAAPSFANESPALATSSAQVRSAAAPRYPYLLQYAEAAAEVTVAFTVDAQGKVTKAKIADSSNFEFNAAALAAIKQWSFTPALKNGQAIETKLQQKFVFSVNGSRESNIPALLAVNNSAR